MNRKALRIGYVVCIACGIVFSIIGVPFAVAFDSTQVPFMGNYQVHSVLFLGSPLYSWSTWNGSVGVIDFFIAFVLNSLICFVVLLIIERGLG
jgi:hypothetical protein